MRIGIQTWGTDGDIRPLLLLGGALSRAGHTVDLVATNIDGADHSELAREVGVSYRIVPKDLALDPAELHADRHSSPPSVVDRIAAKVGLPVAPVRESNRRITEMFEKTLYPHTDEMLEAARMLCATSDVVIGQFAAYPLKAAALASRTPHVGVTFWPGLIECSDQPPYGMPNLGRMANGLAWRSLSMVMDKIMKRECERTWRQAGLKGPAHVVPDALFSDALNLVPVSPALLGKVPDWTSQHRLCGFFKPSDEGERWEPSPALAAFLADGPPPVFLTLGSPQLNEPEHATSLLVEAARLARCRAVIRSTTPRFAPGTRDGDRFFIDRAPHQHLFSRCSAIVHHGGAGTTQSACSAERPSVVVALMEEQHYFGDLIHRRGAGASPLRYLRLDPAQLARQIRTVLDDQSIRRGAVALGRAMRAEDGLANAVELIERFGRSTTLRAVP